MLLSSGPEEEPTFGGDAVESGVIVVRLVAILIFTVHNVNRESEGQTYAEILQRNLLLKNACTAVFELMSHILERCVQLDDPSSSFLLPGILVFLEWLACCPDVAAGTDVDEKQGSVRSKFWNLFISFLNKLMSVSLVSIDDEDETCFNNMSRYEEGNTENRLALWEDFELRGYVPLIPAHSLLDFSRKHSFGGDGQKEKKDRIKRTLAAGKALASVVRVDQKAIIFDSRVKKFIIVAGPQMLDDMVGSYSGVLNKDVMVQENQAAVKVTNMGTAQTNQQHLIEADEEDEVIVFKPIVPEKRSEVVDSNWAAYEGLKPSQNASLGDMTFSASSMSPPVDNIYHQTAFDGRIIAPVSVGTVVPHPQHQPVQTYVSKWLMGEEASLASSLNGLRLAGNGHVVKSDMQEDNHALLSVPIQQSVNVANSGSFYNHAKAPESLIPSMLDVIASSGPITSTLTMKTSSSPSAGLRKNPVSRPSRHIGPPPGFGRVLPKQVNEPNAGSDLATESPLMDDYSWLDGYQVPSSTKSSGLSNSINYPSHSNPHPVTVSNGLSGTMNFPFPGKQAPTMQFHSEQKGWQDFSMLDNLKLQHEQQLQLQLQQQQQQIINGNQHFNLLPEQHQGQPGWNGRYFV